MRLALSPLVAVFCLGSVLWGGDRVVSKPSAVVIASPEGCVEFKTIGIKSRDGRQFRITGAKTEHKLVNLTGAVGVKAVSTEFLVYLSSTLKPGHYSDVIVFELDDDEQHDLKVPVTIEVKGAGKNTDLRDASATQVVGF